MDGHFMGQCSLSTQIDKSERALHRFDGSKYGREGNACLDRSTGDYNEKNAKKSLRRDSVKRASFSLPSRLVAKATASVMYVFHSTAYWSA